MAASLTFKIADIIEEAFPKDKEGNRCKVDITSFNDTTLKELEGKVESIVLTLLKNDDNKNFSLSIKLNKSSNITRSTLNIPIYGANKFIYNINNEDLINKLTQNRSDSLWKFYEFLYVRFDVYEMDSPIGAPIELPQHLLTGSNQQYLIKYDKHDDKLCFWRCLAYCIHKPDNNRRVEKHVINLFNEYYENKIDIKK